MDTQTEITPADRAAGIIERFHEDGHPYYDELLEPIEAAITAAVEAKVRRYAEVLEIFGTFYSATMADSFKEDRPVITRRTSFFGKLMGLADKVWLTADDFRLAGYVLHADDPRTDADAAEMGREITARGVAYLKRHPEQAVSLLDRFRKPSAEQVDTVVREAEARIAKEVEA